MPAPLVHRSVEVGDITMRVTEQGEGTPIVLCHGFPGLAYSWRHQLTALSDAGFRVIAPDMRAATAAPTPQLTLPPTTARTLSPISPGCSMPSGSTMPCSAAMTLGPT